MTGSSTPCCGSPPHAWGILGPAGQPRLVRRFTPTRVGNTLATRRRGACQPGSPPHAWGILILPGRLFCVLRFTPTRVGNTQDRRDNRESPAVHPHTRGEYTSPRQVRSATCGSPPHAWGIHCDMRICADQCRFTPTRVGNTLEKHGKKWLVPWRVNVCPRVLEVRVTRHFCWSRQAIRSYLAGPVCWGDQPRLEIAFLCDD